MKNSTLNTFGSISIFLIGTFWTIFCMNMIADPLPTKPVTIEQAEPMPEYQPPFHRYPCAAKGTLRFCPQHKQKGIELK
jgi:hypothetical protein